jgi:CheY-like chemotaxis protein
MPKKILLADDSLTIQKVVELTFSDSDYELVCVSNGERALEKVRENRPDLILADVVMPEKNGYEVCEAIKGDPATSRIPVVLLSGTFEPFDRSRAERIGADAIVSKPFDSQQLLAQVDALVARSPSSSYAAAAPTPIPQTTAAIAIPDLPPPPPLTAATAAHSDDPPFDVGFSAEDFTAAVRMPPARTGIDPFEEEYVRGDVDSAIEAFEKAHPRFGFGSEFDAEPALASQPLERSEPRREEPDHEEPRREEAPRREEPAWLRDEPDKSPMDKGPADKGPADKGPADKGPFGASVEERSPALDFSSHSSMEDEAATMAISRPQIPTVPMIPADQLPTVEMPTQSFSRDGEPDRRSPLETADASASDSASPAATPSAASAASAAEPSPFETAAPGNLPVTPREISEQDASVLFDVAPRRVIPDVDEPHPIADPDAMPELMLPPLPAGSAPPQSAAPPEAQPEGSSVSTFSSATAERETEETTGRSPEPAPAPAAAASGMDAEAPAAAVPGDIEMLAQRSSIPELTRMLSSMRSTGDITDEQLDRLAAKVVEKLSDKIVREIAWEVIPDMAEIVIRQRIKELEAGVE